MSAIVIRPYFPFGPFRAEPRPCEELIGRQLSGAGGQAALIGEVPALLRALAASIESEPHPEPRSTALAVSDVRALCNAIERLHDLTHKLHHKH